MRNIPCEVVARILEYIAPESHTDVMCTSHAMRAAMSGVLFRMPVRVRSMERIMFWENEHRMPGVSLPGPTQLITLTDTSRFGSESIQAALSVYRGVSSGMTVSLTLALASLSDTDRQLLARGLISRLVVRDSMPKINAESLSSIHHLELHGLPVFDDLYLTRFSRRGLRSLYIYNTILVYPSVLSAFTALRTLRLGNNWLGRSRSVVAAIGKMKHLTLLDISDNHLSSLALDGILPKLRVLVLDENNLHPWSLVGLGVSHPNLRSLSLRDCGTRGLCVCSLPAYADVDTTGTVLCTSLLD
jgi:hypothetical protein